MFTIARNSNKVAYGIKHFVIDTEQDLKEIPLGTVYPGSTAIILESSARYMLNNKREWVQLSSSSGGSGNGSGGSDNPYPDNPGVSLDGGWVTEDGIIDGEDADEIILDGGTVIE